MKVLITTDLYATSTNGVVTSVRDLMEELEKKGHEVRVLTVSEKLRSHKEENIYYIKSVPLGVVYPDVRMPLIKATLPRKSKIYMKLFFINHNHRHSEVVR